MTRSWRFCSLILPTLLALVVGCTGGRDDNKKEGPTRPLPNSPAGTEGANQFLAAFVAPGADHAQLSRQLRPTKADYEAVFDAEFARKAEAGYSKAWDAGQIVVAPKAGQTEVIARLHATEDLKAGKLGDLPGGYQKVARHFKDGHRVYAFKFVKPGEQLGMAYDGLIHVNGNWRLFPKPWRVMAP